MLNDFKYRLRALFRRNAVESEMDEELRAHLERQAEKHEESGMPRKEALRRARLEFGGVEQMKEECRDARGLNFFDTMIQDFRYGLRMLGKSPAFTAVAIATLALGIGANTAVFSVVQAVLMRSLPYPGADRLVAIWERVRLPHYQSDENNPAPGNFSDWRDQNRVFDGMAGIQYRSFSLTGRGEPARVEGEAVSANLFDVLQVAPLMGRVFNSEEDRWGGPRVVLLGYGLWADRFGRQPDIVGQTVSLNDETYEIVGVMPKGFAFPDPDDQLWVPLGLSPQEAANHGSHYLRVIGRLKPQVTLAAAQADMDSIARRLTERYPDSNTGVGVNLAGLQEDLTGDVRPALLVIWAAVVLILLMVCANETNLLLARASARRREMAIRAALGASRARIAHQLLTESIMLALAGGGLGLLLATWGVSALRQFIPADFPRAAEIGVNGTVLGFTLAISLAAGLLIGIVPAFGVGSEALQGGLGEGARQTPGESSRRFRRGLIILEMAMGIVVLTGAGLVLRSFLSLRRVPLGFQPGGLLTLRVILPQNRYGRLAERTAFYRQASEKIAALPGVESAGAITFLPLTFAHGSKGFTIEGQPPPAPGELPFAEYSVITPDYFRCLQIPVLKGRSFAWSDAPGALPVVMLSRGLAEKYWPGEDPVGKRLKLGGPGENAPWLTVIGVAGDVRQFNLTTAPRPALYFPAAQYEEGRGMLRDWVVRTSVPPLTLAAAVRRVIWNLDPMLPVTRVQTMDEIRSTALAEPRFDLLLLGLFAALALVLATLGLYGVTAYSVAQRTREIAVRMALGAKPRDVLRAILGQGASLAAWGCGLGLLAALALTRLMSSLLFNISPVDPLTLVSVPLLLTAVSLTACYLPARRATKVDPMLALRCE